MKSDVTGRDDATPDALTARRASTLVLRSGRQLASHLSEDEHAAKGKGRALQPPLPSDVVDDPGQEKF